MTDPLKGNGEYSQWDRPIPASEISRADLQGSILAISSVVSLVALGCLAFLTHNLHLGTPGECALSVFAGVPVASASALSVPVIKKLAEPAYVELLQEWHDQNSADNRLPASFGYPGDHAHTCQLT